MKTKLTICGLIAIAACLITPMLGLLAGTENIIIIPVRLRHKNSIYTGHSTCFIGKTFEYNFIFLNYKLNFTGASIKRKL